MKTITTLAAILLAASLTACSAPTITPGNTPATVKHAAAAATQTTPGAARFGDTATFADGLKAVVTAHTIKAGQYAIGAKNGRIVVVTIKLNNPTKETINAGLVIPQVTYGTDGAAAEPAEDQTIPVSSTGNLLPGETRTTQEGFGVPTTGLNTVRVELGSPDMSDPAVFKGAVK